MVKVTDPAHEAVLFLKKHQVSHQMRYSEFEALLDGVVTLPDHAGEACECAYVQMDRALRIRALVFFVLEFDREGRADPDWNVPLQRLARISPPGPDLGAGPIKLATQSQCAIGWHQKDLWDPSMGGANSDLKAILNAVDANRLGFARSEAEVPASPSLAPAPQSAPVRQQVSDGNIPVLGGLSGSAGDSRSPSSRRGLDLHHRNQLARRLRSLRRQLRRTRELHEHDVQDLIRQQRLETQSFRSRQRELEQTLEQTRVVMEQAKEKLTRRTEEYRELQTEVSQYKKRFAMLEQELARTLPEEEADRMRTRMEGELSILREQLEKRQAELFYRDEREEQMRTEIAALKDQVEGLQESEIISRLSDLDVVFVVYHPGAGHVTLPAADVQRYVDNPVAYVAERCFVTEEHYREWLEHYENPICMHQDARGNLCGATVTRVSVPSEFTPGTDNRCASHSPD